MLRIIIDRKLYKINNKFELLLSEIDIRESLRLMYIRSPYCIITIKRGTSDIIDSLHYVKGLISFNTVSLPRFIFASECLSLYDDINITYRYGSLNFRTLILSFYGYDENSVIDTCIEFDSCNILKRKQFSYYLNKLSDRKIG